ncbi:MAG: rhomboid family intramembrane serine protease [Candidatus Omnitrophica bacterium]|nr:rhomboid family intramembrane serine protease [Candidatus Omnitrophota bacterium]
MIPLRDTIPSRHIAVITRLLVAINIAMFFFELRQGAALEPFLYRFGLVPSHWMVSHLRDFLDWPQLFLTLISSQFLHGGLLHLASNLLYLWIFGDNVEDRLGPVRFLLLYLGSGVLAGVSQLLLTPHSSIPMVGASGAIAGVLGAYFLLFPSARIVTLLPFGIFWHTVEWPAFVFLGFWFLLQWFQGLATIGQMADIGGVAFWAHVGGFVGGMIGIAILRPQRRW